MATYYVDDGGASTSAFSSWASAATSLSALDDAVALASNDIVYIGHDHVCQYTHSASRTITGPTSGLPVTIISATQGSSPPAYQKSATNQIDTTEGAYNLTFTGSFDIRGVKMVSGSTIVFTQTFGHSMQMHECTLTPAHNLMVTFGTNLSNTGKVSLTDCEIALADTGAASVRVLDATSYATFRNLTISNGSNRSVLFRANSGGLLNVHGGNFSSLPSGVVIVEAPARTRVSLSNVILPSTFTFLSGTMQQDGFISMSNCGPADSAPSLYYSTLAGDLVSQVGTSAVYRSSGATIEGTETSWAVTTSSTCGEGFPFESPWIYGTTTAGTKTLTVYVANNTADLTDAEAWLEIDYLSDATEGKWSAESDARVITATAANQTDDTGSTWNNATLTYMQSLAVSGVTVATDGQFRARVVIAKPSATVYIDPLVTVT